MKLTSKEKFSAAHKLEGYDGPCSFLHGHDWFVDVEIEVDEPKAQSGDFIIDFKRLKAILTEFDHRTILEDTIYNTDELFKFSQITIREGLGVCFVPFNPTAENLAEYFQIKILKLLIREGYSTLGARKIRQNQIKVKVWESDKHAIEVG